MPDSPSPTLTTTEILPWQHTILDGLFMRALNLPPNAAGQFRLHLTAGTVYAGQEQAALDARLDREVIPRILACVNACTGIRTEDLAAGRIKILTNTFFEDLQAHDQRQRAELARLRADYFRLESGLLGMARNAGAEHPILQDACGNCGVPLVADARNCRTWKLELREV